MTELLTLHPLQLRQTLQQSLHAEVYRRPAAPSFIPQDHDPDIGTTLFDDARPAWILALQRYFDMHHSIDFQTGRAYLEICTWYVNDQGAHHCARPQHVQLGSDSFMWRTDIVFPWRDSLLRATPADFWVLSISEGIRSPDSDTACPINVILSQGLPSGAHPVLISVHLPGTLHPFRKHFVQVLSQSLTVSDLIRFAVPDEVSHLPATVQLRDIVYLPEDSIIVGSGEHIRVSVFDSQTVVFEPAPADHLNMMQTWAVRRPGKQHALDIDTPPSECTAFTFRIDAPAFRPDIPFLGTQTEFVQTLYGYWMQTAFAWEEEQPTANVLVWFVDHQLQPFPTCYMPRAVSLPENYAEWEHRIKTAWSDALIPDAPLEMAVVEPMPPMMEHGVAAHIILVQSPRDEWSTILVSVSDAALGPQLARLAITTPEHLMWEHVITGVNYAGQCILHVEATQCKVWFDQQQLTPGWPIPSWSGYGLLMVVERQANPPMSRTTPSTEFPDHDREMPLPADHHSQQNLHLQFGPVRQAFEWLDTHFTLSCFDVEAQLAGHAHWLPQSLDWLRLEWYAWDAPVDDIAVYYDGSYRPEAKRGGAATAAFVLCQGTWQFAGATSTVLENPAFGSYTAELTAALLATKQAYDLLKTVILLSPEAPALSFIFDSLTVGRQAEGLWQANKDVTMCHAIRSMLRLIETRWAIKPQHQFVPGHSGNPGNEIVDTIALCAAHGLALQDWTTFLMTISQQSIVTSLAWVWTLSPTSFPICQDPDVYQFPAKATTTPVLQDILHVTQEHTSDVSPGNIQLKLLTCNVLTLIGGQPQHDMCGLGGPARLQTLLRQFDEANITLFAVQETRLRSAIRLHHDAYHLLQTPATAKGHFGILLGFAKTRPFAFRQDGEPHPSGWFLQDDLSVVASDPRFLVVRVCNKFLRCLVIAAHAPHSGANIEDIQAFWHTLQVQIPAKFDEWPRVLLADANCRFGDQPNRHIGDFAPEISTPKSEPFCQFVAAQNLFLPATFAELHGGPSGTWYPEGALAQKPLKRTMTEPTWELVCTKRKWRSNLAKLQTLQNRTYLQSFFALWRHSQAGLPVQEIIEPFDHILSQLDQDIAQALSQFRLFGLSVTRALRRDDAAFYSQLAHESSQFLGPADTKHFWKVLRRSLPKFRQRRQGYDPMRIAALDEQWMPHFQQLEVGADVNPLDLLTDCYVRQQQTEVFQSSFDMTAPPSILQLEDVLCQT
eukprot:s1362_g20.t1